MSEEEEEEDVIRGTKNTKDNNNNRIVTGHVLHNDGDAVKEEEEEEEAFKKNAVVLVPTAGKKMNDRKKEKTKDDASFSFSEAHRSLAEKKAYKWAKVKGSPFWPCQVVDVEKFKENVPEFVRERVLRGGGGGGGGGGEDDEDEAKSNNNNNNINSVKLIQFFGTNEYMWYVEPKALTAEEEEERRKKKASGGGGGAAKNSFSGNIFRKVEMESFGDGYDKGYHVKMKTVGLKRAVSEMRECLESGEDPSDVKRGGLQWHTRTIVAEEEEEEEEENAKKTEEKKNVKKKKVSPSSSTGKRKKVETQKSSAAAKERAQKKTKKLSEEEKKREEKAAAAAAKAAVKMELAAQKEEERKRNEPATLETLFNVKSIEEKPFQLSFDVLSVRDPPPFERLRRNRWVCRQAPKQVHSSESVACYCRPIPHSIREEMNANIATKRAMKIASASTTTAVEAAAPLDSITNKLAAGSEDDAQQQQQISEEKGPATPPETLEDPLNNSNSGGSVKGKEKKAPTAKPLPKLRLGCGQDCVNRETRYTCDSRVCPCGDDCSNRPFQYLPQPKVKVQLTENRGYGLFLQQDVFEGDFIVEYMGEIVDEEECSRRLLACKGKNEPNFYLMEITPSQIIDARFCGNNARFINSSCHPNCETQRWVDASTNETRVGIFATEDIKSGTELTYDYNFAHFGGEGTTSFTCFCGHPMCKGTLDANPERMRRFMDRVTVTMKNGDVKTGTVLEYTVNKKYKLLLDDEHDAKAWSKSTISEEEKAEFALKRTKNRKYITVNLDNVDDTAKKSGAKKDAKLACVWLTNRTNFTESKIKKKKVDLNEKKKTAKGADAKNKKRKRKPTKRPPPPLPPPASKQQQQQQPLSKTATTTMSPLKEIVVTPVKRLVESAIANVVNRQQNNRNPSSSSSKQQQNSPIQRALQFFANK